MAEIKGYGSPCKTWFRGERWGRDSVHKCFNSGNRRCDGCYDGVCNEHLSVVSIEGRLYDFCGRCAYFVGVIGTEQVAKLFRELPAKYPWRRVSRFVRNGQLRADPLASYASNSQSPGDRLA